jgi:hypothetical protein
MKYIFASILLMNSIYINAQKIYSTKKDISNATEIVFFGYDFSNFKLVDPKSVGNIQLKDPVKIKEVSKNPIKQYISSWVGYLLDRMGEKYFAKHLKTSKVIFDFDYTFEKIKNLSDSNIIGLSKTNIPKDSIQSIINDYQVKQKEGIGFAIIVECFNKSKESTSAYFTFFDIASKKVIMTDYFITSHADGIGLTNHWGYGLNYTVNSYMTNEFKSNVKSKRN